MADKKYQGVTRSVCIGLGGTGLQTIMRLRRLVVERYGSLDKLPIVRFVQIDTDSGSLDNANLAGKTFHRGVDISLRDDEKVHIGMKATDADNLRTTLMNSKDDTPYEHIREWLPDHVIHNARAIDKGAGGIRPVGRLAFFHNYAAIKAAITFAEKQTGGTHPHLMKDFGLNQDEGLDFFVIGSLYGGTGSGTFLDIAYTVRTLYPNATVFGYLVVNPELPSRDGDNNGFDQQANIYAALMELDFYSRSKSFKAFYDKNDPQSKIESNGKPPFSYTFLIGRNTNNPRYEIKEKDKLFNLIAQKIAIEFSSRLAPKLKEKRDDFNTPLAKDDDYPRPNPQYYLTFGLSEIYCPLDRIIEITAARVSTLLMQFWQAGFGQAPDIMTLMQVFYTTYDWYDNINERSGLPERKLSKISLEGNNTADSLMTSWKSNCENSLIDVCETPNDRESLATELKNTFRNQFRKVEFGDTDATRGAWFTKIMREVPTCVEKKYRENIEAFSLKLLDPTDAMFSIANTQSWVIKLIRDLNDNRRRLEREIGELSEEKTLDGLESRWREMESEIEEENRKFGGFGLRNKNQNVKIIARRYLEETRKAIEHNRKLFTARQSLEVTDALTKYCKELSKALTISKSKAVEIESAYGLIESERKDLNLNELNGESIFTEQDLINAQNTLMPEKDLLLDYQQITDRLFKALKIDHSLVDLLRTTIIEDIVQKLNQVLESIFSNRIIAFGRPVIEAFLEKYQPSQPEASKRLRQILDMAEPRLPLNLNASYYNKGTRKRFVGFYDEQTRSVETFKNLLNENDATDSSWIPLTDKDRILVVTEFAPFPLRIIEGIENYDYQYKLRVAQNKPMHNDKRVQFTNIVPPSKDVIDRLQDLFFPCLAMNFIGDYKDRNLSFKYWSQTAYEEKNVLLQGNWDQCMETIYGDGDSDLFNYLEELLREFEQRLTIDSWGVGITKGGTNGRKVQIDAFQNYVINMPDSYNKRYEKLLTDKDFGILERFRRKIDRMLNAQKTTGVNLQSISTNILTAYPNDTQSIDVEVVANPLSVNAPNLSEDLRRLRRDEMKLCKVDLEEGVITQEEYKREIEKVRLKYPI